MSTSFLLPLSPTWDKLCALFLNVLAHLPQDEDLSDLEPLVKAGKVHIFFEDQQNIPDDTVDVDVKQKYHGRFGSAMERVVVLFSLQDLPGVSRLIGMLAKNNETGYLKEVPQSLVALIRELNNVGSTTRSPEARLQVIYLLWPAVWAYFGACARNYLQVKQMEFPFTLRCAAEMMMLAGVSREEAMDWMSRVQRKGEQADHRHDEAQTRIGDLIARGCRFQVTQEGGLPPTVGHFVETDNTRVAGEYFRSPEGSGVILVVRRSSGNVGIFCRGPQDLESLHATLDGLETGQWYQLKSRGKSPMLLNGSTSRAAAPTKLTKKQLIGIVQKHFRYLPRKMQ